MLIILGIILSALSGVLAAKADNGLMAMLAVVAGQAGMFFMIAHL